MQQLQQKKWDYAVQIFEKLTLELPARDTLLPASHFHLAEAYCAARRTSPGGPGLLATGESFATDTLADFALFRAGRAYQAMWRRPVLDPQYGSDAVATFELLLGLYPKAGSRTPLPRSSTSCRSGRDEGLRERNALPAPEGVRFRHHLHAGRGNEVPKHGPLARCVLATRGGVRRDQVQGRQGGRVQDAPREVPDRPRGSGHVPTGGHAAGGAKSTIAGAGRNDGRDVRPASCRAPAGGFGCLRPPPA